MPDPAAKSYYVITLRGDRGPYSRADLAEALQAGEVAGEDHVRTAFGRPLGSVTQVLQGPISDRATAAVPAVRPPPPASRSRPWLVPLLMGGILLAVVAAMMALRGGDDPHDPPPTVMPEPPAAVQPAPPAPVTAAPHATADQAPVAVPGDVLPSLPEARGFRLVCDLNLLRLGPNFRYKVDNRESSKVDFDRIAYLVELSAPGAPGRYVWTAMDPFSSNAGRIALPTVASKTFFQTAVRNLQVRSNAPGVTTGDFDGGNIEFWPCDYTEAASASVPGASSERFDISDTPRLGKDGRIGEGYGCMQVHNTALRQTLFAINNWRESAKADLGIGNAPGAHSDWTFAANAASYSAARLRVLIRVR